MVVLFYFPLAFIVFCNVCIDYLCIFAYCSECFLSLSPTIYFSLLCIVSFCFIVFFIYIVVIDVSGVFRIVNLLFFFFLLHTARPKSLSAYQILIPLMLRFILTFSLSFVLYCYVCFMVSFCLVSFLHVFCHCSTARMESCFIQLARPYQSHVCLAFQSESCVPTFLSLVIHSSPIVHLLRTLRLQ